REHAAWAIQDYGFDVVISSFFADIFKGNALNNGLLPIKVSDDYQQKNFVAVYHDAATQINVNLVEQTITLLSSGDQAHFDINAYKKSCLINGYDDIDYILNQRKAIEEYEDKLAL
ncbi:MAG: leuD, partial [Pedobacter sp.]|nr:leuD [Pedobacter sp.]